MECADVLELLRESIRTAVSGEVSLAIAYSGGLDSSIIAAISREFVSVRCYSCVVPGSFDERNVRGRAAAESLELTLIKLTAEDICRIACDVSNILDTYNPTEVAYTIPVLAVVEKSREKLILAGHGADELFGGYAKYASVHDPEEMMRLDVRKMLGECTALEKAAAEMGKRAFFPFAGDGMTRFAQALPLNRKISTEGRKIILREAARKLGLDSHDFPKKAAQYSSGVLKEMKKLAKSEGRSLTEWIRALGESREGSS